MNVQSYWFLLARLRRRRLYSFFYNVECSSISGGDALDDGWQMEKKKKKEMLWRINLSSLRLFATLFFFLPTLSSRNSCQRMSLYANDMRWQQQ